MLFNNFFRKVCLICICLAVILVAVACESKTTPTQSISPATKLVPTTPKTIPIPSKKVDILIEGEVTRGFYIIPEGPRAQGISPIAYNVKVIAYNKGGETALFDVIKVSFSPLYGKPLTSIMRRIDETLIKIPSGEKQEFNFTTNGYTFYLLDDAGSKPLEFSIVFYYDGKVIAGPFVADLPDIKTLPSYEQTLIDKSKKGQRLEFLK